MNRNTVLSILGSASGSRTLIVSNQSVFDIIKLIKHKHGKCAADYDRIAAFFWAGNLYETCLRLWRFCRKFIRYDVETEDVQTVSSPQAILTKGVGDCKHYSLFIGGVLDALSRQGHKIDWFYRFASYNPLDFTPGHVFIVVNDAGREIWIDPVLDEFDWHKFYISALDKDFSIKKGKPGTMSGIILPGAKGRQLGLSRLRGYEVLQQIGTTAQTGYVIEKVSAAVAAIPVYPISTIVGAAGAVIGFFLATFGNKYTASTQVRWLTQLYEYYVMGNAGAHSDNTVNENDVKPSQIWFANVLGVPIYDRLRWNSIAGRTGSPAVDNSYPSRIADYMKYPDVVQAGVTYEQAQEAAQIADTLQYSAPPGGWKGATYAPSLIDNTITTNPAALPMGTGFFSSLPPWVWLAIAGVVVLIMSEGKKH